MNNKQPILKRKKSNNNQPNNQQSKRKKSNNNQKRPQKSRKLRRINTYVHNNLDDICYIYSTFTLINNNKKKVIKIKKKLLK